MNPMNWFSQSVSYAGSMLDSPVVNTVLDSLILVLAVIPVAYVCAIFLFGEARRAQELLRSPALRGWLIFFCIFEVLLYAFKVPIVLKIAVLLIAALVVLPLFVVKEILG
jgi:hypothetical protein